jgi:hypothetical protein
MGNLSNFKRGQIIDTHFGGVSVTETAILLGVSRATLKIITVGIN